jgi:hypothetical protein
MSNRLQEIMNLAFNMSPQQLEHLWKVSHEISTEQDSSESYSTHAQQWEASVTSVTPVVSGGRQVNSSAETPEEEDDKIYIWGYSAKSIVVTGKTISFREKLKELGGKWNTGKIKRIRW